MSIADWGKVVALLLGVAVVATMFGYPQYALAVAGVALIGAAFTDLGKKMHIGKDWQKAVVAIVGIALVFNFGIVANPVGGAVDGIAGALSPMVGQYAGDVSQDTFIPDNSQPAGNGNTQIITTTATQSVIAKNLLNKSDDSLNPSGFYLKDEAYQTLSFSSGKATIASLDPYASIDKISLGTDGTFYWAQKSGISLNGQLSPTTTFEIVRVPSAVVFEAYDRSYNSRGFGAYTVGGSGNATANTTVNDGSVLKGTLRFEVTSKYTGARDTVIAIEVGAANVSDASMPGLNPVTCPSGIITTTNGRELFRCFETGVKFFIDSGAKAGVGSKAYGDSEIAGSVVYGSKDMDYEIQYKTGKNPTAGDPDSVTFHILDRDEDYRSSPGSIFFLDPASQTTNLGWTVQPSVTVYPA